MYSSLPMFQRIGGAAYKADLDNTVALMNVLNSPHRNFKTIHIAGTNGKGSTSHILASILQEMGLKTGLYTSPHLRDFRERIRINGEMISETYVVDFVEKHKTAFERIMPSFFEMTVGMAFQYFSDERVDIAIIEVGMGGRLDSTNVITPELSIITNIGFDHTMFLGDTLGKIAVEKAGIIKSDVPIVIGQTQRETKPVFNEKALQEKTSIVFADQRYKIFKQKNAVEGGFFADVTKNDQPYIRNLYCPLGGNYQLHNLATVLQSIEILNTKNFDIKEKEICDGIKNVVANTGLKGRWQVLNKKPLTICDTGHNKDGITYVTEQLKEISYKRLHFVLGTVNDKDINAMLALLPKEAAYYFSKPDIPRGLEVDILYEEAKKMQLSGEKYNSVSEAYRAACAAADDEDLIFIGGSNFVVAEVC